MIASRNWIPIRSTRFFEARTHRPRLLFQDYWSISDEGFVSLTRSGLSPTTALRERKTIGPGHAVSNSCSAGVFLCPPWTFLVKPARAIAGSIVLLWFRSDAAMSESRQTVRDFQPRQLFTAMHVELWREFLRSVERSDGNVNFVRPAGRFVCQRRPAAGAKSSANACRRLIGRRR